jgi:hypothetical protein
MIKIESRMVTKIHRQVVLAVMFQTYLRFNERTHRLTYEEVSRKVRRWVYLMEF